MESWKEAIIKKIKQKKRPSVSLQEIYHLMETHPLVTPYHRKPWKQGGQPRYECWIRQYLTKLIRENRVKRVGKAQYTLK